MPTLASVLLLEPDADNREMYAESLAFHGFRVLACDNATDGLRMASEVDVIVTASAFPADRIRIEQAGADVFLAKPCLPETLSDEIRRLLAFKGTA